MAAVKIGGKEYPLAFTVRSKIELGKVGGGHSYADFINSLQGENTEADFEKIVKAVEILHDAYKRREALDRGKEYNPDDSEKIDPEMFLDMTQAEWNEIEQAVIDTIKGDSMPKVETAAKKKK